MELQYSEETQENYQKRLSPELRKRAEEILSLQRRLRESGQRDPPDCYFSLPIRLTAREMAEQFTALDERISELYECR
mgnify:CR=1 FL=1